MTPRHPVKDICHGADASQQDEAAKSMRLFASGFPNILLCYACICSLALSPLALLFAITHAEHTEERLFAHYHYIRTTIAIMVIGSGLGGVMIILGADISKRLILAGLLLAMLTGVLAFARCIKGTAYAVLRRAPRGYSSYIL